MVEDFPAALYIGKNAFTPGRYLLMPRLTTTSSLALLAIAVVGTLVWCLPADEPKPAETPKALTLRADAKQVQLEITIADDDSGLSVQVKRRVPEGTTALDAMRATVAMQTKDFKELGQFVTSLCGVEPAKGKFWSPDVDGKRSPVGVAQIKIEKDTRLDWKTRTPED
jgi:hypothetical protein